ncbi:MAG TPA: alpha/beta fold hydrolase [Rubrobacteraceae bacterium]|nr:alpha/beta fold hydrolase [Rubrobacteraceae bacterium]
MKAKKESMFAWRGVGRIVALAVLPLVALITALTLFSMVLRHGGPRVRDGVRVFNKRVLNPAMMRLAGRRHWYASVLRHKGRRSGREYTTPVVAEPVAGDAFVVPLPYGEGVDWLKNVLAAGRATIEAKGETYNVFEPEVLGAEEAFPLLDERHRRTWRRFGIERFLRLKKLHHDPAAPRWEELRRFRATHPTKHTSVNGVDWEYIVSGEGEEALLILPGGAMVGEAGFTRIPNYEQGYRVIAPSYASVSTAAELLDGLTGVLDAEGVRAAHVIGQSYGGLVAQCFVRRYPERVRSLILTNTLVPPRSMPRLSEIFLALLPLAPVGRLRALRERGLSRAFYGVPGVPPEDQAFWRDYQHGLISRMTKAELLDVYRLGIDLIESYRFAPDELASWPGRVFILESDEDFLTPEKRDELRRRYPQAGVYTIHGAGHTPWMSHREEYLSAINEFLAGHVPAAPSGASLEQRLQAFRRAHHYREIEADGLRWRYVVGGRGERAVLLPSGGTRVPDMYLLLFEALEPHFRVISPSYPAARSMDALVDGLAAVLDAEGVERADLFGSSFGGFVAQCFVRRHPERVRSLILANTGAPGASPLPGLPLLVRLLARLPQSVVRRMTGWNWRRWFVAPPEEREFWYGLLDELLATRLTKADLVSALEEMLDYSRHNFGPRDLDGWTGRILVIESENDKAFSPDARAALRALYPRASVRTFADAGHAVMVTRPAEYISAVRSFLEEP